MLLTLRFIGIITIACIGTSKDPCSQQPYVLRAYLPDGTALHQPCFSGEVTPAHRAFIRVNDGDEAGYNWPGRLNCVAKENCHLYPLSQHDVIFIDGVTNGNGMSAKFIENPIIQWSTYEPGITLANDAIERSLATMSITAGTAKSEELKNHMLITTGTFTLAGSTVRIAIDGTGRYVDVKGNPTVDIVNLPKSFAMGNLNDSTGQPHKEHFYLHYMLAGQKPVNCAGPEPPPQPAVAKGPHLVASISCSDSNFP